MKAGPTTTGDRGRQDPGGQRPAFVPDLAGGHETPASDLARAQAIAHLGNWRWDLRSGVVSWSDELFRIFGVDPGSFVPSNDAIHAMIHPEDQERHARLVEQALRGEAVGPFESRIIRPGGEERVVLASGFEVQRDERGQPTFLLGTILDITERKRAEEALSRREAVLAQAGKMAHLGAWEIEITHPENMNANPLTWSDEVYRIFGYQPRSLPVSNDLFFERVHPDDRAKIAAAVAEAIANKHSYSIEHRIVRPDGSERVVQENAELVFNHRGVLLRVIGAVQDVTERKQIEDALREMDQRKNEFMGMLSHELRNPLTPIRNSLYILERAAPGGEQAQRAYQVIERQTAHLARLVDDLLDVTRIARGKVTLQRKRIELCELVRRTAEDHRSLFAQYGIELVVKASCAEAWIHADPTRIAQVIGNLLQNALKFTDRGGKTVVSIDVDRESGCATLKVWDTGQGIEPGLLVRIFQPFIQVDQSLDRSKGGLGLGLALVKGMVELHGGTVVARSEGLGKGAEFSVCLPLDKRTVASPMEAPIAAVSRQRVLIIEDNVDAAESLKEALALGNHEVAAVFNGPEGLVKAREFRPDVVLCDIGLPGMSGYEVARAFRADPELKGTHLIALTGYAGPDDQQQAKQAGFDLHLSKPPVMEKLEEALARVGSRH